MQRTESKAPPSRRGIDDLAIKEARSLPPPPPLPPLPPTPPTPTPTPTQPPPFRACAARVGHCECRPDRDLASSADKEAGAALDRCRRRRPSSPTTTTAGLPHL